MGAVQSLFRRKPEEPRFTERERRARMARRKLVLLSAHPDATVATTSPRWSPPPPCTHDTSTTRGGALSWSQRIQNTVEGRWGNMRPGARYNPRLDTLDEILASDLELSVPKRRALEKILTDERDYRRELKEVPFEKDFPLKKALGDQAPIAADEKPVSELSGSELKAELLQIMPENERLLDQLDDAQIGFRYSVPIRTRVTWCAFVVCLVTIFAFIAWAVAMAVKAQNSHDEEPPSSMDYQHDVVRHSDNVSF